MPIAFINENKSGELSSQKGHPSKPSRLKLNLTERSTNQDPDKVVTTEEILWHLNHCEWEILKNYLINKYLSQHKEKPFTQDSLRAALSKESSGLPCHPTSDKLLTEDQAIKLDKLRDFTEKTTKELGIANLIWQPANSGVDDEGVLFIRADHPTELLCWIYSIDELMNDADLFENVRKSLKFEKLRVTMSEINGLYDYCEQENDCISISQNKSGGCYRMIFPLNDIIDKAGNCIEEKFKAKLDKFESLIGNDSDEADEYGNVKHLVSEGLYIFDDTVPEEGISQHLTRLKDNKYTLFFQKNDYQSDSVNRELVFLNEDKREPKHVLSYTTAYKS